jgi:hypothetical protein
MTLGVRFKADLLVRHLSEEILLAFGKQFKLRQRCGLTRSIPRNLCEALCYASGSPLDPFGDANLGADGGDRRWLEIQFPFTISVSMAQRLAKIELMRRRQQGTGIFIYNLALYQAIVLDIIQMTLPMLGWGNKLLEIAAFRFTLDKINSEKSEITLLGTQIDANQPSTGLPLNDPERRSNRRSGRIPAEPCLPFEYLQCRPDILASMSALAIPRNGSQTNI